MKDIADFETEIRKVCELYREKLPHAALVGTLDTVKMSYHIATIQNFTVPPVSESPTPHSHLSNESPAPVKK